MWLVIALLGGLAVFLLSQGLLGEILGKVRLRLETLEDKTSVEMRDARIYSMSPRRLVQLMVGGGLGGLIIGYAVSGSLIAGIGAGALCVTLPRAWLARQRHQRQELLELQLPGAIDQLVSSVRAGLSLPQAIREAAGATLPPVSDEFRQMSQEEALGLRLPEVIESARTRIGGRAFPMIAAALLVSIERGGNLPEALLKISESLKEIGRLEQKIVTASAEARKAVRVIMWMPVVIAGMVLLMQPDLALTLTSTGLGWVILIAVGIMYTSGIFWLKRLIQPDV